MSEKTFEGWLTRRGGLRDDSSDGCDPPKTRSVGNPGPLTLVDLWRRPMRVPCSSSAVQCRSLLGHGDGTFGRADSVLAGAGPTSVAGADFNGEGISDLAVGNRQSHNLFILLGRGDGTFRRFSILGRE